jgi:8-oxo-dGTP diphosphatase
MSCWILESERLLLRPPHAADVAFIVPQVGDWEVAKNLGSVPHPYCEQDAENWLALNTESRARGTDFRFAILRKWDGVFIGACGVHLRENGNLELGYWLGKRYWGHGYATEAARRLSSFAFRELKADRLVAGWFHDNPASGNVLAKLGFRPTGVEKRDCRARGAPVACNMVSLNASAFARQKKEAA